MDQITNQTMRILLVNHGSAGNWGGGDGVQMQETAKRLALRGHEAVVMNSDNPETRGYDIVHIFNCRTVNSLQQQIYACKKNDIPIVISPIWISISRALWGSRGTLSVLKEAVKSESTGSKQLLEALKKRRLVVEVAEGNVEASGHCSFDNNYELISTLLNEADGLLPNSWLELQAVRTDLNWSGECFEIAHYGVDPGKFLNADPEPFRQFSGIRSSFVLQAGRIEPAKNQAMLCWALRNTEIKIILIGGSSHWPSYADLCKQISGDKITIIDHIPQNLLASAYASAAVHVLPTWMETCGLVTLEAALSGTPVVGSTFGHELEYLKNDCWYCDPADENSIYEAIKQAMKGGRKDKKAIQLKKRVLSEYNWEQAAEATEMLYKRVLNQRKR